MKKILMLTIALGLFVIGCASKPLNLRTHPADFPTSSTVLEDVKETAGGFLFWGIIPTGVNDRFDNADQEALGSAGANHLIDAKGLDYGYYIPYVGTLFRLRTEAQAIECETFQSLETKMKHESTVLTFYGDMRSPCKSVQRGEPKAPLKGGA